MIGMLDSPPHLPISTSASINMTGAAPSDSGRECEWAQSEKERGQGEGNGRSFF
jgi:hypothetical protein